MKQMETNGEVWPSVEELKGLPSDDPLKCLATNLFYKTEQVWQKLREMERNGEVWPSVIS